MTTMKTDVVRVHILVTLKSQRFYPQQGEFVIENM